MDCFFINFTMGNTWMNQLRCKISLKNLEYLILWFALKVVNVVTCCSGIFWAVRTRRCSASSSLRPSRTRTSCWMPGRTRTSCWRPRRIKKEKQFQEKWFKTFLYKFICNGWWLIILYCYFSSLSLIKQKKNFFKTGLWSHMYILNCCISA